MEFLSRMMPPARWRLLCLLLLVVTILCCLSSYIYDSLLYQNAGIICIALAIGGTLGFWRCPRCHRILPLQNMLYIEKCPKCKSDVRNFKN